MKRLGLLMVLLCSLEAAREAAAQSATESRALAEGKYKVFIQRNPFGLKDPPPPPVTKSVAPAATFVTYLTGITANPRLPEDAKDRLTASFQRREPNKKSVEFNLKPGQAKDGLEVVAIEPIPDSKGKRVRVIENGVPGVYTFAQNGIPQPRGGPPPSPGQPTSLPGARVSMPSPQVMLPSSANQGMVMNPATGQLSPASTVSSPTVRTLNPNAPAGTVIPQPNVAMQTYSTVAGGNTVKQTAVAIPSPSAGPSVSVISGAYQDPKHPETGMTGTQQQALSEWNRVSNPSAPPTPGIPPPNLPGNGAQ